VIISRFYGGLGNQMFQYAAGRALALRHQAKLVADSRPFRSYNLHAYLIDRLNTVMTDASKTDLGDRVLPPEKRGILRSSFWTIRNRGRLKYFRERSLRYDPSFECLGDETYLQGYWQSEKYFQDIRGQLRAELTRPEPVDTVNMRVLDEMKSVLAVSLHIRRGDYVSNSKTHKVHGTCPLEYYYEAAACIADQTETAPAFFIFSDDPEWTRENLKLPHTMRFVSHNTVADPWLDLQLMQSCQHHIIANSSFSWWGAWLNASAKKIVVAPARWFADPGKDDRDIVPETWVRLGPK
jgi:hypothetical protein